ncbi:ThiF family adenylyltransferase [Lactococcus garvieae]|uniref:ThiF family adenylyltransferase n=2 Tax=Lactococcus garvieae TaxID=1363 RepID=UPI000BDEF87F|nr:ThiF family adenylyltransferase [Lactococcus garvieae]QPR49878.1 ThiF family adenylyltransferase [Lactococcus garvieae]
MLYEEGDIGKKKIDIAKKRLQEINPEANITTINKQIFNKEQIQEILGQQKYDFVVNTMDNPRGEIRYIVDEAIYDLEIPYIYNGSSTSTAIVGPMILKGKTKKYGDLIPNHENSIEKISRLNDKLYVTTVIEPLNGSVGQFTAFEVIKYITGCANPSTFATRIALNMDTMEIDKYEL